GGRDACLRCGSWKACATSRFMERLSGPRPHSSFGFPDLARLDPDQKNEFALRQQRLMSSPKSTLDELRIDRSAAPQSGSKGRLMVVALAGAAVLAAAFWWLSRSKPLEVRTVMARQASSG